MPDAARAAALLVALTAILAGCSAAKDDPPPPPPATVPAAATVEVPAESVAAIERMVPLDREAQSAFASQDWDESIDFYGRAIDALGDAPATAGWRDQALYNLACAHARAGRPAKAAETFAESVAHGLRPVVHKSLTGAWFEGPGLTLEHVLADSDFDTIRTEPAYVAALKPFLAAGEPVIELTAPEVDASAPAVIVLAAEGEDAERALPAWRVAAKRQGRALALIALAGPVRTTPSERRWILADGDERWAVAKVREALDLVAKDVRIDAQRVFLVGAGARPGEAVWAAATAESARLAGFAAPGARFHAAWHADAIAALPVGMRAAVGEADELATKLLKDRGIDAVRLPASNDESATAAAVLDAMLGGP